MCPPKYCLTFGVPAGGGADGRVAVAEAGCAAEVVLLVDVEEAGLAGVALLALHVRLARTHAVPGVTGGLVAVATSLEAVARFATLRLKG